MLRIYNIIHRENRGFTLVELLIVVIILAVLSGISVPSYMAIRNRARESGTENEMKNIATTLAMHNADNDSYPTTSEGLAKLEEDGYIADIPDSDLWGNKYIYESSSGSSYVLRSCGVDGEAITEDDIVFEDGIMTADGGYSNRGSSGGTGSATLYSNTFENMDGLKLIMGGWSTTDGSLKPSVEDWQNCIVFGEKTWTDFEISVNTNLINGNGYGVYYRCDDNSRISGYIFQYDPAIGNKFLVRTVINGYESPPIQQVKMADVMPDDFTVHNKSHNIKITVEGSHHIIKVDDESVFDFSNSLFTQGMAGFRSWCNSDVDFEDIDITDLSK